MVKPLKLKKEKDIELLRESGSITSEILRELAGMAKPGVSLMSLEKRALEILESHKFASSAFLDYLMEEDVPYPAVTNLSVNEIAIHGIPSEKIVLQNGDVLSIDTGVDFKWRITDAAVTVPVGDVSPEVMKLMRTTYEATLAGIEKIRPGNLISDIYKTVTNYLLDRGYATSREYVGHGVGFDLHEQPLISNRSRTKIRNGLVLAVEPLGFLSRPSFLRLKLKNPDEDAWTMESEDGSIAVHYEMAVALINDKVEILTPLPVDCIGW
jgi:methionyl aminopeptidase